MIARREILRVDRGCVARAPQVFAKLQYKMYEQEADELFFPAVVFFSRSEQGSLSYEQKKLRVHFGYSKGTFWILVLFW